MRDPRSVDDDGPTEPTGPAAARNHRERPRTGFTHTRILAARREPHEKKTELMMKGRLDPSVIIKLSFQRVQRVLSRATSITHKHRLKYRMQHWRSVRHCSICIHISYYLFRVIRWPMRELLLAVDLAEPNEPAWQLGLCACCVCVCVWREKE